ncbi:MAG: hypothetical protein U0R26_12180 [Solirubrobacterales bacterium]
MVITERFAWAHLPKTAGDATAKMFAAVPGLVRYQAPLDSNEKHDGFWVHAEAIEGKLRVMNMRRLPSWILSYAHHKAISGVHPDFKPLPMASVEEMADETDPDEVLRWTTGPEHPVQRWLRAENLAADVERLLRDVGVEAGVARSAIASVPWVGNSYDHDVSRVFTAEQVGRMYENTPDWAAAELEAYGGGPSEAADVPPRW